MQSFTYASNTHMGDVFHISHESLKNASYERQQSKTSDGGINMLLVIL